MAGGARVDDAGVRTGSTIVFVSDPTAEAERVAQALRAAGYVVVDVPLSMLVARVAVQHPRVVLVDADGEGALDVVGRMRELPDADSIDVLFLARAGGAIATPEQALAHEGSGLFVRPVDVPALVRKVDTLTGGAAAGTPSVAPGVPMPSVPAVPILSKTRSSSPPSLPPASMRSVAPPQNPPEVWAPPPPSQPSSRGPSSESPLSLIGKTGRRVVGLAAPVSLELQQLLADAEQRAQVTGDSDSMVPSPEDEIEAVLPSELLESLDEPIEEDEDDDVQRALLSTGARDALDDEGGVATGAPGTGIGSTGGGRTPGRALTGEVAHTPAPPLTHGGGTHSGGTGTGHSTTGGSEPRARPGALPAVAPSPVALPAVDGRGSSLPPPTAWSPAASSPTPAAVAVPAEGALPAVLTPGDAFVVLARAIVARVSGSLCFAAPDAERRVVLREGDVVTASSTAEDESLLAFLGVRGDLPKETVRRLASKFPPFGRHAGAALVARGYLRQDQMWTTLRAHAEWLVARALQTAQGRLLVEAEPPGRLAGEPSVFGGATGASVYVEVVRRIVPPAEALDRLGGPSSRLSDGPGARLLDECALGPTELDRLRGLAGRSLDEVLRGAPEADLGTVLYALALLGVVEVLRGVGGDGAAEEVSDADLAAVDAEGVRERVRARMQLVEDGDYFALLGVSRDATGYEVRRAFLDLRRSFDASRVLTPAVADLADDVKKITLVLEEAYDILKDAARRERYRRAIEAVPDR